MVRKSDAAEAVLIATRKTGLDVCDAILDDLCRRGLLAVTPEALHRLEQHERSLQSYKLARFSRELAAIRRRMSEAIKSGRLDAAVTADRLSRLQAASARLRKLLDDPLSDRREIEELAGRTWRQADLEIRENVLLAELGWESLEIEEGFRLDTSYFLARGGEVLCERKIVPLEIRAAIDTTPKPQHPEPAVYPAVGVYPGDLPRRVKLLELPDPSDEPGASNVDHNSVRALLRGAPESIAGMVSVYAERRRRPFPPDALPVVLASPRFEWCDGGWRILDVSGAWLEAHPPPGIRRRPSAPDCLSAFEDCALSIPVEGLVMLLFESGPWIFACPLGAVTPEGVLRFGLDVGD